MPLNPVSLTLALTAVFQSFPPTAALCAAGMASAYSSYAAAGMFGAGVPLITGSNTSAMTALLLAAIASPLTGNPAAFGAAWSAGLTAFWMTPPIVVTGAQSGVVTGIPGAAAVAVPLGAAAANLTNTAPVFAAILAAALHAATLTTLATVAPPPGTIITIL